MKTFLTVLLVILLAACSSMPPRYLADKQPIINVDSEIAPFTSINASAAQVSLTNLSKRLLALQYQITWYDKAGVTQLDDLFQPLEWTTLLLPSKQRKIISLQKPTIGSSNYRIYVKAVD